MVTLAHLHTNRAYVPLQTNVLEAAPDMQRDTEKEWYYSNKEKEREGPYSFKEVRQKTCSTPLSLGEQLRSCFE